MFQPPPPPSPCRECSRSSQARHGGLPRLQASASWMILLTYTSQCTRTSLPKVPPALSLPCNLIFSPPNFVGPFGPPFILSCTSSSPSSASLAALTATPHLGSPGLRKCPVLLLCAWLGPPGVDGVKVDCQAGIGLVPCSDGTPHKSAQYQYALEVTLPRHLSGQAACLVCCNSPQDDSAGHWTRAPSMGFP